jgi:hypothetical protein
MQNDLGDSGVQVLSRSLLNNQTLSNLNLCGNGLGPDAAAALAEVLRVNRSLKNIGMNLEPTVTGINAKNQTSHCTDHVFDRIYGADLPVVATCADVNNNRLGEAGALALLSTAVENDALNSLSMWYVTSHWRSSYHKTLNWCIAW